MGIERRRDERTDVQGTLSLAQQGSSFSARVVNISRAGACIITQTPLNIMDAMSINAEFDCGAEGKQSLNCEAVVVRCTRRADGQFDVGLFFTVIEPAEQERLERIRLASIAPTKA